MEMLRFKRLKRKKIPLHRAKKLRLPCREGWQKKTTTTCSRDRQTPVTTTKTLVKWRLEIRVSE